MAHDVFISYSSRNKPVADAICAGLEARRIRCWIAPRDVLPRMNYGESIVHAIAGAEVMVLVFSEATNLSQAVVREAERAMHHNKPIIPFRIDTSPMAPGLEFFLASCHWLDALGPPLEGHIERLGNAVERILGRDELTPPRAAAVAPAPQPAAAPSRAWIWGLAAGAAAMLALAGVWVASKNPGEPAGGAPLADARTVSLSVSMAGGGSGAIRAAFSGAPMPRYEMTDEGGRSVARLLHVPAPGTLTVAFPASAAEWIDLPPAILDVKSVNHGERTIYYQRVVIEVSRVTPPQDRAWLVDGSKLPERFVFAAFGAMPDGPPQVSLGIVGPHDEIDMETLADPAPAMAAGDGIWEFPLPESVRPDVAQTLFGKVDGTPFDLLLEQTRQTGPRGNPVDLDPVYDLEIPDQEAPFAAGCDISQYLQANEGDRFFLRLSAPVMAEYEFRMCIEYDDGGGEISRLEGPAITIMLAP